MDYTLTAREQARLDLVTAALIEQAQGEGLTITPDQVRGLSNAKLAYLTDEMPLDSAACLSELRRLPEVAEQVKQNEIKAALADSNSPLHQDIRATMNPAQRMTLGREIEASREREEPAALSAEETAAAIAAVQQISSPTERLAFARRMGLA